MAANDDKRTLRDKSGSLVEGLAQQAISKVGLGARSASPIQSGTEYLVSRVLCRSSFDIDAIRAEMDALQVARTEIIDHCIPTAARALGSGWLEDQLSFAKVSTASARLFGLCKAVSDEWAPVASGTDRAVLLATVGREDHMVGPAIVAEQLRRRGVSVQSCYGASADAILERMQGGCYEAVWISTASYRSLDLASKAIKTLKGGGLEQPIILGGAILDYEHGLDGETGADLVTKDLDKALAAVANRVVVT